MKIGGSANFLKTKFYLWLKLYELNISCVIYMFS